MAKKVNKKTEFLTKKDLEWLVKELRKHIKKITAEVFDEIKIHFAKTNKKLDKIYEKTKETRAEINTTQKFMLDKLKEHEERLEKLETTRWKN